MRVGSLAAALLIALGAMWPAPAAFGQVTCPPEHDRISNACSLGTPGLGGVSVQEAITAPGQTRTYKFQVTEGSAAHIYLGDLWFDIDMALVRDPPPGAVAEGEEVARWYFVAEARDHRQRVLQFVQPEIIVRELTPDYYTLVVVAGDGRSFDAGRPYTLRVALSAPVCGEQRDPDNRYQVAMTRQPQTITPFTLLSFTAIVSPPYSDLYDFDWRVDGQPVATGERETLQIAASELPQSSSGRHQIEVTARGVREYPDPDPRFRHTPPTVTVSCTFAVS